MCREFGEDLRLLLLNPAFCEPNDAKSRKLQQAVALTIGLKRAIGPMDWAVDFDDQSSFGPKEVDQEGQFACVDQHVGLRVRQASTADYRDEIKLESALEISRSMGSERAPEPLRAMPAVHEPMNFIYVKCLANVRLVNRLCDAAMVFYDVSKVDQCAIHRRNRNCIEGLCLLAFDRATGVDGDSVWTRNCP